MAKKFLADNNVLKLIAYMSFISHSLYLISDYFQDILNTQILVFRFICGVAPIVFWYIHEKIQSYRFLFILTSFIFHQLFMAHITQLHWANITSLMIVHIIYSFFPVRLYQFVIHLGITIALYFYSMFVHFEGGDYTYLPLYVICINLTILSMFIHYKIIGDHHKVRKLLQKSEKTNSFLNKTYQQLIHDVKSPLTALKYLSENEGKENNLLSMATERVEKIIFELEQNKNDPSFKNKFNFKNVIDNIINEAKIRYVETIHEKSISFNVNCKSHYIYLNDISEHEFARMISNIINNAIEAQCVESHKVSIAVKRMKSKFIIKVNDNGKGVSEEDLDLVMNRGYTTKDAGSGLGLAYARDLVKRNNGEIKLYNDNGLTVELRLNYEVI